MAPASYGKRHQITPSSRSSNYSSSRGWSAKRGGKRGPYGGSQYSRSNKRTPQIRQIELSTAPSTASQLTAASRVSVSHGSIRTRGLEASDVRIQGSGESVQLPETGTSYQTQTSQNDDDTAVESQIIMAIDVQSKDTVGCCYYSSDDQTLYLFEDITSGGDDMIEKSERPNTGLGMD